MLTGTRLAVLLAVASIAVPALALGAGGSGPPRPAAGKWRISAGGFHITRKRTAIYGFHTSGSNCSLGQLHVAHQQKLRLITEGGVSNWVIGRADPTRTNPNQLHGVIGQVVKLTSGKKHYTGRLEIIFGVDRRKTTSGSGDLVVKGCDIPFEARH